MIKNLLGEARQEPDRGEGVDTLELGASLEQFGKLIGSVFDLRKYRVQIFYCVPAKYHQEEVLRSNLIVRIGKVAHDLAFVKTARQSGTQIRTRQQNEMEGLCVRAIDGRTSPTRRLESLPAMSALPRIPLQLDSPAAPMTSKTLTERGSLDDWSSVQKTLLPVVSQVIAEVPLGVQQRTDLRTGRCTDEMTTAVQVERNRGANGDGLSTSNDLPQYAARHYTVAEIGALWSLSDDAVRKIFEKEPGVLVIGDLKPHGRKRRYTTLRIPQFVLERVHRRLSKV